ncbi:heme-binding protein 2 [Corythoichthys intestinalis]|uniref:heme-binding protein 2 n=1 Tax=Corythoichthys intestinalis TaxID=161448 RepID=UPI0025A59700|nr:heme-binding protein 2 [Corythoichthys intestinalis]
MYLLAGFVGCLLFLTVEAEVGKCSYLPFKTETSQCMLYNVTCKCDTYEARHYEAATWVTTTVRSWSMDYACYVAFMRLYKYICGENDQGKSIEMTSPVVMKIGEEKWLWEEQDYQMSFLLPKEHQAYPPEPTDHDVLIYKSPAFDVYVRSYGGWMFSLSDSHQSGELMYDLEMSGASFEPDCHFGIAYNGPKTLFNRHNEVWVPVTGKPHCPYK